MPARQAKLESRSLKPVQSRQQGLAYNFFRSEDGPPTAGAGRPHLGDQRTRQGDPRGGRGGVGGPGDWGGVGVSTARRPCTAPGAAGGVPGLRLGWRTTPTHAAYELTARNSLEMCGMSVRGTSKQTIDPGIY